MNTVDKKYEALFTPWKVGNVEIKNRIVMCPMGGTSARPPVLQKGNASEAANNTFIAFPHFPFDQITLFFATTTG